MSEDNESTGRGIIYLTYSVPDISDMELRALAVCTAAIEGHLKEDKDAMKRVVDYLSARYRQTPVDLMFKT